MAGGFNNATSKKTKAQKAGAEQKEQKPGGRRKAKHATAALEALQTSTKAARAKYTNARKTNQAYSGYIARGEAFLADVVSERRKKLAGDPSLQGIDTELLAKAFSKPPNKYSAIALELFMTQKCVVEGLGKSTAEGIHGAYAKFWDTMDGDKYAKEYKFDEQTDTVTGCPARAGIVQSLLKIVKIRDVEKGAAATRNHAEAISAEDMKVMMDWSESICPSSQLRDAVNAGVAPADLARRLLLLKHGMMRGFASSGFTLWTRRVYLILCGLQMRDLTLDCVGPLPFNHAYFKVFLDGRKGWQHKQGYDSTRESNEYNIYSQPELPALDMYNYLTTWLPFYELCIGRKLRPDDYIFPYIASNGAIHPDREMTLQMCQDLITEFTEGAGLKKSYTTHSFRRRGAQYRFMFAPLGKRWSLSIIRWWGGWASGEHVDTLMKYLLDSLQSYETGHGDALCPVPREADKSFMGEHLLVKPVATGEFRSVAAEIITQLGKINLNPSTCTTCSHTPRLGDSNCPTANSQSGASAASVRSSTPTPMLPVHVGGVPQHREPDEPLPPNSIPLLSDRVVIIPGVFIPDLKKGDDAWLHAVHQWEHGDPEKGLTPLRDWPRAWFSDGMRRVTGSKRSQRKLIFDEYERYVWFHS
ncbi:hypothetical protein C8R44DRAFT_651755 [Mycena epipterygia]|nr:hypothetical protein C8R44DRAFT_651755 [Mycena epipterygia]